MNTHIFQTLINWNNLSESKDFQRDFSNTYELKKEINRLKEPFSHFERFLSLSAIYYAGFVFSQFILFLLRRLSVPSFLFSFVFCTIIYVSVYIFKHKKEHKKIQAEIATKQSLLDSFDSQIQKDLYNFSNFELIDNDYQKYCVENGLIKQYNYFKMGLLNQNLENAQILAFYQFMKDYCNQNINNTPIGNIQVKTVNGKNDNFNFFEK